MRNLKQKITMYQWLPCGHSRTGRPTCAAFEQEDIVRGASQGEQHLPRPAGRKAGSQTREQARGTVKGSRRQENEPATICSKH